MLKGLADAGYAAYAIDLLGSGYSSKPSPTDDFHLGHNHLFVGENENERRALEELKARMQSTQAASSERERERDRERDWMRKRSN